MIQRDKLYFDSLYVDYYYIDFDWFCLDEND